MVKRSFIKITKAKAVLVNLNRYTRQQPKNTKELNGTMEESKPEEKGKEQVKEWRLKILSDTNYLNALLAGLKLYRNTLTTKIV